MLKLRLPMVLLRFLVAGGANTAITYSIYLIALIFFNWSSTASYTLAYAVGLLLAYGFNRRFVFKSHRGWQSVLGMPLIYVCQYLLGVSIVWIWVNLLNWYPELAPLAAIVLSLPVTFFLSNWLFTPHDQHYKK